MNFLEKDLEEIIFEQLQTQKGIDDLVSKGLYFISSTKSYRQLRIGNYGIADIVNVTRVGSRLVIDIVELKKDKISMSSFLQAVRYTKGIMRFFESREKHISIDISITLIGREIDNRSDFIYIPDIFIDVSLVTYSYGVDGIRFEHHNGYKLTDEGFKS